VNENFTQISPCWWNKYPLFCGNIQACLEL